MKAPYDEVYHTCPLCGGTGWSDEALETLTEQDRSDMNYKQRLEWSCDVCEGNGKIEEEQYKDYCIEQVDWDMYGKE